MILIADSGSTKSSWALVKADGTRVKDLKTIGYNPYFYTSHQITESLSTYPEMVELKDSITQVFFYGAGCSTKEYNSVVETGLSKFFTNASVLVDHDLVAAAYATYTGEPAITCINGTGSNSCFFDGTKVREEVPALAYILGDEASGSYFGKRLIRNYLYKRLPAHIQADFEETYKLNKEKIVENVYHKPHANVFLASFMEFVNKYQTEPLFEKMLFEGFYSFLDIHVTCFPEHKNVPVHFIGSIAFYFRSHLEKAADQLGVRIGNIVRRPIDGLVDFHFTYKLVKNETV